MLRLLLGVLVLTLLAGCDAGPVAPEARNEMLLAKKNTSPNAPVFSISCGTVAENAGPATCDITKTGSARSASSLRVRTVNSSAVAPTDYTSFDQDVSFSKNQTSSQVTIPIANDDLAEDTETFRVVVTANTNARISVNTGVVTITDSDSTPIPTQTCWDGSVIPETDDCRPEPMQTCPDGSSIPATDTCPVLPPETQTCWDDSEIPTDELCPDRPMQTCSDGSTIPATDTCPPAPPPPPPPSQPPPTSTGLAAIASNFDVTTALSAAGIPGTAGSDPPGAFRFICGAGQLNYDDPIVYPGQQGQSHLHQYYGNLSANYNSTFASLRGAGESTCNNMAGTGVAANRSAYWMPAMLDGKGHVVVPDYVQVYYKRIPQNSPGCDPNSSLKEGTCIGIPNGVRFISGFLMSTMKQGVMVGEFHCGANVWKANAQGLTLANNTTCPVGRQVEMLIASGRCWNGQTDSADHMSHVTNEVRNAATGWINRCPSTHPYLIPQFTIGAFFTVGAGDDVSLWKLSSDMPGMYRGQTVHFDYFEGWDEGVKNMWTAQGCIDHHLNCSAGNMGNGKSLKGASVPTYGWANPNRLVPIPVAP